MGWGGVAGGRAGGALQEVDEVLDGAAAGGDLEHRADEDADHVAHERVGGDSEATEVAIPLPAGPENLALEPDVVGLGRGERGEVVGPGQRRGAGVQTLAVERVRPPEGATALERARRPRREDPVAIAARGGVTARVEGVRSDRRGGDGDIVGPGRVDGAGKVVGQLGLGREARDLAEGVDAGVGAARDRQVDLGAAENRRQRRLQLALDGPQAGLPRPAAEPASVVFDVESDRRHREQYAAQPKIGPVRVLLTNDDGISAPGLQAARRALRELDGVEVDVIAPDSNRSATARSITTRSPLTVEEVEFGDGDRGFATDGTPVDCVRFAELGLLGGRPDLIVSGINHGSNLGDDITYSGTVAAAFEGIVLGIPALAVSQQSSGGGMGYVSGRFDFGLAGPFTAQLVKRLAEEGPLPPEILVNVNLPSGEPTGIEVTRLGKRLYNDELRLVGEDADSGKLRYEIYGFEPSFRDEEGTDLSAVARGRVSVTPIHFDLTDHGGLERLRGIDFEAMLASATV